VREAAFVRQNKEKWIAFERALDDRRKIAPDQLADLYIQLTNDLSYAQTYYRKSKTLKYLNSLAIQAHQQIYINKKESGNRLWRFFSYEFPLFFSSKLKYLLFTFSIFIVAVVIGVISTLNDPEFTRLILGDNYVDMTIANIIDENPTGVYQDENAFSMFIAIAWNNIRVGMLCFAFGLLTALGSCYILFTNGVMVGTFFTMFYNFDSLYDYPVFYESQKVIWLHGTIELSVIIISGCAGLIMGNSILFPGTYKRLTSFKKGAKDGLKVLLSTIPLFLVAAFIEGFVTRYASMPDWLAFSIIGLSLCIIIGYYVLYPLYIKRVVARDTSINPVPA